MCSEVPSHADRNAKFTVLCVHQACEPRRQRIYYGVNPDGTVTIFPSSSSRFKLMFCKISCMLHGAHLPCEPPSKESRYTPDYCKHIHMHPVSIPRYTPDIATGLLIRLSKSSYTVLASKCQTVNANVCD